MTKPKFINLVQNISFSEPSTNDILTQIDKQTNEQTDCNPTDYLTNGLIKEWNDQALIKCINQASLIRFFLFFDILSLKQQTD